MQAYRTNLDYEAETLDSGRCSGLAEDVVGPVPWWDGWTWDTGAAFDLNKPCHTTASQVWVGEISFSRSHERAIARHVSGPQSIPKCVLIRAAVTPTKLRWG